LLASIDLLVAVLLAIALGISTGYMISGHDRFARRVVSPVFRISVILLVFVLGFSGGSSMARYEYISTFYIFLSIAAALLSGLLSITSSALLERILGSHINTKTSPPSSVSTPIFSMVILMAFIASTSFGAKTGLSVDKEHISLISDILLIVLIYSVSIEMGMDRDSIRRSIYAASKYRYVWVGTIIGSLMSGMVIQIYI
jgi:uncharacterized membrane protein YbjE (DUF340 family)